MIEWSYAVDAVQKQATQPVYTLVGVESVLSRQFIDALAQGGGDGSACAVHRFWMDEAGLDNALFDCRSLSLFGERYITVIENAIALSTDGKGKLDFTDLEAYLADPAPDRTLVIVVPADKLDERRKVAKLLKKYPVVNCQVPPEKDAVPLLEAMINRSDIAVEKGVSVELFRRVRTLTACQSELQKFQSFLDKGQRLSLDMVRELTPPAPEDNVFTWVDGVVHGRVGQALEAVSDLQHAGYEPFALLSMLSRQLRLLWYGRVYGGQGMSPQDIAKLAGAHPYAMKVAVSQARSLSVERIESLLLTAGDAEFDMKRGLLDPNHALTWVVLACSGSSQAHSRAI